MSAHVRASTTLSAWCIPIYKGPFDVESSDGFNYSMLLTDDYTGRHHDFAYLL